jgi:carbon-monoxide dehydrogenase iron sulfur subunit
VKLSRLIHNVFLAGYCRLLDIFLRIVVIVRVAVVPDRCTGCRVCELVCSELHEGTFQPSKARIQILSFDETVQDVPVVCQQCIDAPCLEVCPQEALSRDAKTNAVVVDQELCIQCGTCVSVCVIGLDAVDPQQKLAIRLDEDSQMILKCDLCDGDPQCVKFCPTQALVLTESSVEGELTVEEMMEALEYFLRQKELPLPRKESK